ncbi:DUF3000 domain-containing protein [Glutamicibacter sp. PS]|uniref:DUF3000 domain-containing protein n=1 Tax=Glutamicibacter sp. PS TaxID=3075634 RepID=UPI00284FD6E6|nr:DUF3000 domain-containing protein [Glutamicibacter sp. PS]MDR4532482.1 DUF3000 domain-containing protein [Glutamicibacter sp. PS]
MSELPRAASIPAVFSDAVADLARADLRRELHITKIPPPGKLAPFALALSADVYATERNTRQHTPILPASEQLATGRFVLLYDPQPVELWEGNFRVVSYIRASLDEDMGQDPLLASVAWSWLEEALEGRGAQYRAAGGTATRVMNESFGNLAGRSDSIDIELRASWTPTDQMLGHHLSGWADMVGTFAGLPPLPEGVQQLPRRLS